VLLALLDQDARDRSFFAGQENMERLAAALGGDGRSVTVILDEEHNLYRVELEERNGHARSLAVAADIVLSGEFRALSAAYQAAGARVADVATAFDTNNFAMTGTWGGVTVPQNVANICNWTLMCPAANIHPNATGYQIIATTLDAVIDPVVTS